MQQPQPTHSQLQPTQLTQRDFGPATAGNLGDAYLAAASFERERLRHVAAPTNQTGVSAEVRALAKEACEQDIMRYERAAEANFKTACLGLEEIGQKVAA